MAIQRVSLNPISVERNWAISVFIDRMFVPSKLLFNKCTFRHTMQGFLHFQRNNFFLWEKR